MKIKYRLTPMLAFGITITAWGQQGATPAKPADNGPTLAETMIFIQEKLTEQGQVGWAEIRSNQPGFTFRNIFVLTDVMADPAACTFYGTSTLDSTTDLPKGRVVKPGGAFTADDLHTHTVTTSSTPLKQIEKITVEKLQDVRNEAFAEAAHPDITVTVTPPVFFVKMSASNAVLSAHTSTTQGNRTPVEKDVTIKTGGIPVRDEETANKVAKAMNHAMELCGGGPKKEIF
jgi:hypothetical protein